MKEITIASVRSDPRIRQFAVDIATGLAVSSPIDAAMSIENIARQSFTLVDEPEELLIDPSVQLDDLAATGMIRGDCDDAAMLVAALLYSIGLRVRFKACIQGPDGSFQHVFTEYMLRTFDRWIPVDPTIQGIPVYSPGDWVAEEL